MSTAELASVVLSLAVSPFAICVLSLNAFKNTLLVFTLKPIATFAVIRTLLLVADGVIEQLSCEGAHSAPEAVVFETLPL